MEEITASIASVNDVLWNTVLLILLVGTGVYFTFRLKFIQIRKFKQGFKQIFGGIKFRGEKAGKDGMSPFQSVTTAIAAQVGTGNIVGASTAIASGGPGAIFWMWLSAFFGMATNYAEATLAVKYRTRVDGQVTGGPVYYIREAFRGRFGKVLAGVFSILLIIALGFMGNMVQSNSIGSAFATTFHIDPIYVGIVLAVVAAFVFMGGIGKIASLTEKMVPIMAAVYLTGALIVILANIDQIGFVFKAIFVGAFSPQAVWGGAVGIGMKEAIRYGVARGLFSNEAGMGSTPHAHAVAKVKHPCEQGRTAIVCVFLDTFVVLTMTVMVVVITRSYESGLQGAELAQTAFGSFYGMNLGNIFVSISLLFFAFSTIIGWYFFGEANVRYLFGSKAVKFYAVIVIACIVVGTVMEVPVVWQMADLFNGLMVIPNLLALLALSRKVSELTREYDTEESLRKRAEKENR